MLLCFKLLFVLPRIIFFSTSPLQININIKPPDRQEVGGPSQIGIQYCSFDCNTGLGICIGRVGCPLPCVHVRFIIFDNTREEARSSSSCSPSAAPVRRHLRGHRSRFSCHIYLHHSCRSCHFFVPMPPLPPPPNASPSSFSSSVAGMSALIDCCCLQEVEVKKKCRSQTTAEIALRWGKKLVNRRHRCDRPYGLTQNYGLVLHLGSTSDEYLWHSKYIGGVGGLEVGLWCQNYHGAVNRNGSWSHFWAGKARIWDSGFEMTSPQWLSMCPRGHICMGTSTVSINQDQVGLMSTADYDVNGRCQRGGVNFQRCTCFLTSKIYWSRTFFSLPYILKMALN